MSVQPNTDGYLIRSASLPANSTGWTVAFWFQRTGSVGGGLVETLFEIVDDGDGDYCKVYLNDTHEVRFQGINDFEDVLLFTATLNTWYFLALRTTSSTAGDIVWRADSASSLSSSTGRKFQTDNGWDRLVLLNNSGFLEGAQHFRMTAYKEWWSSLNDTQLLTESRWRSPQAASPACYLPFIAASGSDQSGNGRNFTVTGTLASSAAEPASMDVLTHRLRAVPEDFAIGESPRRKALPFAALGAVPPAADLPTRRPRVVGDGMVISEPTRRRIMPLAAYGGAPVASFPGERPRAMFEDLLSSELPRRRALPLAALEVPPVVPPIVGRRPHDRQRGRELRRRF